MTADAAKEPDVLAELVVPMCRAATYASAPELVLLLDRLRTALAAIASAGSLEHRRGAVAMRHLEFEIAPVLETIDLDDIVERIFESGVHHDKLVMMDGTARVQRRYERFPINTGRLYPGHSAQITITALTHAVRLDRFHIQPLVARWFAIDDISINDVPQISHSHPAALLASSPLHFGIAPVGAVITMIVRYTGDNGDGVTSTEPFAFYGAISGELVEHEIRFSTYVATRAGTMTMRPGPCTVPFDPMRLTIPASIAHVFFVESLMIGDVEQIPGGRSGLIFSDDIAVASCPTFSGDYDYCPVGTRVELRVRYTGPIEGGQLFEATLSGPSGAE